MVASNIIRITSGGNRATFWRAARSIDAKTRRAIIGRELNAFTENRVESSVEESEFEIVKGADETENREQIDGILELEFERG